LIEILIGDLCYAYVKVVEKFMNVKKKRFERQSVRLWDLFHSEEARGLIEIHRIANRELIDFHQFPSCSMAN
jgi:hypothetical protein